MARTPEGTILTENHQAEQTSIRAATLNDLLMLWSNITDPEDLDTFRTFAEIAADPIAGHRAESAEIAARYFTAFRRAEDVQGTTQLVIPGRLSEVAIRASIRAAALVGFANGRRAGQDTLTASRNGFVRASGSATRLVSNGGRETIVSSIKEDEKALGWMRITGGLDPCAFCRLLASRGAAFKSRRTGGFQAHDHCNCTVEPFYEGSELPEANRRYLRQYRASQREARELGTGRKGTKNNALNNFRAYVEGRD